MSKKVDQIIPRRSNRQLGISPVPGKLIIRRTKAVTNASKQQPHPEPADTAEDSWKTNVEGTLQTIDSEGEEDKQQSEEEKDEHHNEDEEEKQVNEEEEEKQQSEEEETVQPSTGEAQTQEPKTKKRKTRGPTKMRGVAKHHEDKVEVEFNSLGEHVGKGSVMLSSFLGPLVREHVPVLLEDWRHLDGSIKDIMWEEIQGRFNLTEEWQKDVVFRQMGGLWRCSKSRLLSQVRKTTKKQVVELKPSKLQSATA